MNGLFARLIDAAVGRGEALRPPPRARFAPETGVEPLDILPQPEPKEEEQEERALLRSERSDRPEMPLLSPPRADRVTTGPVHAEPRPRADTGTLLPPQPTRVEQPTDRGVRGREPEPPAAATLRTGTPPPATPLRTTPAAPQAPLSRTGPDEESPLAAPSFPRQQADPEPARRDRLLTETTRRDVAPGSADAAPPEIRIGRIEVRPPAPSAVAKATPRPHRPARAAPRQSLDDYLSSRRR